MLEFILECALRIMIDWFCESSLKASRAFLISFSVLLPFAFHAVWSRDSTVSWFHIAWQSLGAGAVGAAVLTALAVFPRKTKQISTESK